MSLVVLLLVLYVGFILVILIEDILLFGIICFVNLRIVCGYKFNIVGVFILGVNVLLMIFI